MLEITPATIEGVRLIRPTAQSDRRGRFVKTMREDTFSKHGIPTTFAEQYYSVSSKNVLRGLHFQTPPHGHYKLVTCIEGDVFDVVVDLRRGSPTFGQHQSFEMSGANGDSVFVPFGCAHGFYVRSETAIMLYSVGSVYAASHDSGIRWDSVGISWPAQTPIISERDAALVRFSDFETPFEPSSNAAMSP